MKNMLIMEHIGTYPKLRIVTELTWLWDKDEDWEGQHHMGMAHVYQPADCTMSVPCSVLGTQDGIKDQYSIRTTSVLNWAQTHKHEGNNLQIVEAKINFSFFQFP